MKFISKSIDFISQYSTLKLHVRKFFDHIFHARHFWTLTYRAGVGVGQVQGTLLTPSFVFHIKLFKELIFKKSSYPIIKTFHEFSSSILNFQKKLGVYKFSVLVVHHHFKVKLMCTPTDTALPWLLLDCGVLRTIIQN